MNDITLTNKMIDLTKITYSLTYGNEYVDEKVRTDSSHIHSFIEIYLNVSGDVSFLVKNALYPIKTGDIIITRPSEFHHCIYHNPCTHEHFCLWISQDMSLLPLASLLSDNIHHLSFTSSDASLLISLFHKMYNASINKDVMTSSLNFLQILTMLNNHNSSTPNTDGYVPDELQKILDYININYGELTSVCSLTDIFYISMSTLNRKFAKYLHISPKSYLDSVKLANAKRMLDEGKSVTDTCNECGYADSSHFIRIFKKKFGITPHKYKSEHAL